MIHLVHIRNIPEWPQISKSSLVKFGQLEKYAPEGKCEGSTGMAQGVKEGRPEMPTTLVNI